MKASTFLQDTAIRVLQVSNAHEFCSHLTVNIAKMKIKCWYKVVNGKSASQHEIEMQNVCRAIALLELLTLVLVAYKH